jgi:hypothetical protein
MLVFGSIKYRELATLHKKLKIAKSVDSKKQIQKQIDYLQGEIKKEESSFEDYLAKR